MSASHPVMLEIADFFSALRILVNELDEEIVELFRQKRGPTTFFYNILSNSENIDYLLASVEKILWSEGGGNTLNHSETSQYGAHGDKNLIWDHHMQRQGSPAAWKALQVKFGVAGGNITVSAPQWEQLGNDPTARPDTANMRQITERMRTLIDSIGPHLKSWRDPMYSGTVRNIGHTVDSLWGLACHHSPQG